MADIPVGVTPSSIAAAAGGVWALNADDRTLSKIAPGSLRVEQDRRRRARADGRGGRRGRGVGRQRRRSSRLGVRRDTGPGCGGSAGPRLRCRGRAPAAAAFTIRARSAGSARTRGAPDRGGRRRRVGDRREGEPLAVRPEDESRRRHRTRPVGAFARDRSRRALGRHRRQRGAARAERVHPSGPAHRARDILARWHRGRRGRGVGDRPDGRHAVEDRSGAIGRHAHDPGRRGRIRGCLRRGRRLGGEHARQHGAADRSREQPRGRADPDRRHAARDRRRPWARVGDRRGWRGLRRRGARIRRAAQGGAERFARVALRSGVVRGRRRAPVPDRLEPASAQRPTGLDAADGPGGRVRAGAPRLPGGAPHGRLPVVRRLDQPGVRGGSGKVHRQRAGTCVRAQGDRRHRPLWLRVRQRDDSDSQPRAGRAAGARVAVELVSGIDPGGQRGGAGRAGSSSTQLASATTRASTRRTISRRPHWRCSREISHARPVFVLEDEAGGGYASILTSNFQRGRQGARPAGRRLGVVGPRRVELPRPRRSRCPCAARERSS